MTTPAKFLKTSFLGFIGITTATFFLLVFSSCQISANYKNVDKDGEINQMVNEIFSQVDSFVRAGHSNPVAYLDSVARASTESEIKSLFRKYTAISYYYSEYKKN